ncbi:2523_t:CDS:2, partial [Acaulospora colombiana]
MSSFNFAHDLEDAERGENRDRRNEKSDKRSPAKEKLNLVSPYAKYAAPDARIWGLYLEEAEAEDRELMEPWNKDLDSLLIFAGLFAGILTAFIIESRKELYEDPQTRLLKDILGAIQNVPSTSTREAFEPETSFLNINGLWFNSLTLTLSSALGGVLSKGWIAKHGSSSTRKTSNDAYARHLRASRIRKWRVGAIISVISLLIQIALFLFFVGLVLILWDAADRIKFTVLALVSITSLTYLVITFLPWIFPACPLQTPITEGTPWIKRPMVYGQRFGSSGHRGGNGGSLLKELISLYEELRSIPEPQELQAQTLAWIISNT